MTTINYSHPLGKSFMILLVERSILVRVFVYKSLALLSHALLLVIL
jgi:hypothetical protein